MKKILFLIILLMFIIGCGSKVEEDIPQITSQVIEEQKIEEPDYKDLEDSNNVFNTIDESVNYLE